MFKSRQLSDRIRGWQVRRARNEEGFTLVELLVVVVILLVLASVAIPIYLGQQDNARRSAVKSALQSVQNNVATRALDSKLSTGLISNAISDAGYSTTKSKGKVYFVNPTTVNASANTYKITAGFSTDGSSTGYQFTIDQNGQITEG